MTPEGMEAEFLRDPITDRIVGCPECGAAMQCVMQHKLPCATCASDRVYLIQLPRGPLRFVETNLLPSSVDLRRIILKPIRYADAHFPDRKASFWWLTKETLPDYFDWKSRLKREAEELGSDRR